MLNVQMGERPIPILFVIVRKLAIPDLFGTTLINKFMQSTFLSKEKIVQFSSRSVPIHTLHEEETEKTEEQQDEFVINVEAEQ